MIKRLKYWLTHKWSCKHCCLFCKWYDLCKSDSDSVNTCVVCGAIIPEGRQVCPKCEGKNDR